MMESAKRQRRTPSFSHKSIDGKLVQIDISSSFFELRKPGRVSERLLLDSLYRIFFSVVCQRNSKDVSFAAAVPAFYIPKIGHKSISILSSDKDKEDDSFDIRVFCEIVVTSSPTSPTSPEPLAAHVHTLVEDWVSACNEDSGSSLAATLESCQKSLEDQNALRDQMQLQGGIAFVANGSVLVGSRSGSGMQVGQVVPFESPPSLEVAFNLPHRGEVRGLLVRAGVNVIVGGGNVICSVAAKMRRISDLYHRVSRQCTPRSQISDLLSHPYILPTLQGSTARARC
jgi:hypothetical protein